MPRAFFQTLAASRVIKSARRRLARLAPAILLAAPLATVGCSSDSMFMVDPVGPAIPAGAPLALDIENAFGSVNVVAAPRITAPTVEARLRTVEWSGNTDPATKGRDAWVSAETVEQGGRYILRILSDTPPDAGQRVQIDLIVRLPACDGVMIRNAGGPVRVKGARGSANIANGTASLPGGIVEYRTNHAIVDPVTITSTDHHVLYFVGPGSTGTLDLESGIGKVEVDQHFGVMTSVVPTPTTYDAIFNNGTNPVVLTAPQGKVEARFIENAAEYQSFAAGLRAP